MPRKGERDIAKERMWRGIIRDCQESGLSAPQYCTRENLKYTTFADWRRTISERDAEAKRTRSTPNRSGQSSRIKKNLIEDPVDNQVASTVLPDFVPVSLIESRQQAPPVDTQSSLEVVLTSGIVLRVRSDCSLRLLQSVVSVLEVS